MATSKSSRRKKHRASAQALEAAPRVEIGAGAASGPPLLHYRPWPRLELALGMLLFLGLGIYFHFSELDLSVAAAFYSPNSPHWGGQTFPWIEVYRFGQQPSVLVGIGGLFCFLLGHRIPSLKAYRGPGLYLFILLLLGPGLLVNVMTKGLGGRPRPEEILQFHGFWAFQHAFEFGEMGRGKSFLSGHCASAFYFFAFYFIWQDWRRYLALFGTLLWGALMGWTRISQGAHFLSDVLLAGAAIFLLAAALAPLIDWQPSREFFARKEFKFALGIGALAWLVISNPIYEERQLRWALPLQGALPEASRIDRLYYWSPSESHFKGPAPAVSLELTSLGKEIHVAYDAEEVAAGFEPLQVHEIFQAGSLPGFKEAFDGFPMGSTPSWPLQPGELAVHLEERLGKPYWDANGRIDVDLPAQKASEARLKCEQGRITIGALGQDAQVLIYGNFDPQSLPLGFEAYGSKAYRRAGNGPLIVLKLDAPNVRFEP